MICDTWRAIGFIFHGACIVATCSVIVYWMYMFELNEDTSLVEYKHYYEGKDDIFQPCHCVLEIHFLLESWTLLEMV